MAQISQLLHDGYQHHLRGQFDDAARIYRKILRAEPGNADVLILLGMVRDRQMRHEEAIEHFDKAIRFKPDSPQAHYNRGISLTKLDRYPEAAPSFSRAVALRPDLPEALGEYAVAQRHACNWSDHDRIARELTSAVRKGIVVSPLKFMQFSDDPADLFACTKKFAEQATSAQPSTRRAAPRRPPASGERIRIAYVSGDLRIHPIGQLIVGLIEHHDRTRFEVTAISTGPQDGSPLRKRLEKAFDRFIDARDMTTEALAARIAELKIDVLVDVAGFTDYNRIDLFAARSAPIQVNYLCFPGTMGVDFLDYIVVDPFVASAGADAHFSEKFAHLPDTYLASDPKRPIAKRTPSRAECGLPDVGFVFCCFNGNLKITPRVFDVWMRLLQSVPGSVLWLLKGSAAAEQNLRREAEARGIAPARLSFATRIPLDEHLARHRLADLFLDTFPYNAHTTASDALWAGLPIVTFAGRAFHARVAGSLLHAIGLPDLVTSSLEEYEALAFSLATEPDRLAEVRGRLAHNRLTMPAFDIDRYRRNLEAAYDEMIAIHRRKEPPRAFKVNPIQAPA